MIRSKRAKRMLFLTFLICLILLGSFSLYAYTLSPAFSNAQEASMETQNPTQPPANPQGKIRIGYLEGEEYINYAGNLNAILQGLESLGWIENIGAMPYIQGQENTSSMWQWLATHETGAYLEFVENAHFSLLGATYTVEDAVQRLTKQGDIDVVIAMGTVAGQALSQGTHNVPTMVFSSSNAVQSGIISSVEDSGKDHLWAHMDKDRYRRQVEVFHDTFEFKKLGMLYEDSNVGRVYAALEDVQKVADQRGFELVSLYVDEAESGQDREERYYPQVREAFTELARQVDAMYLTVGTWEIEKLAELLQPFYEQGIPVFSQLGSEEVLHGALLSVARHDFLEVGLFFAENLGRVFNGELPRSLPQSYSHTPAIAINLKVAKMTDYEVPFEILLVADEIFHLVEGE